MTGASNLSLFMARFGSLLVAAFLVALVLHLAACTHAASRALKFSPASTDGLVVFQLGSQVDSPITFTIARFDVDQGRVTGSSHSGEYYVEHHGSEPQIGRASCRERVCMLV